MDHHSLGAPEKSDEFMNTAAVLKAVAAARPGFVGAVFSDAPLSPSPSRSSCSVF